jgi:hypothetical protein
MSDTPTPTAETLAEGLGTVETPAKAGYSRIKAGTTTLGYATPRKDGLLFDVQTSAVEQAPARFKAVLTEKGNRSQLHVTAKNLKTARALVDWMAHRATKG